MSTPSPASSPGRSLLITGGAGFIGANFVHYWLDRHPGDRVIVLDSLTYAGNRASLAGVEGSPKFSFIPGDIRDYGQVKQLLRDEGIDTIVHFAAESHVDRSILGPDEFIDTNVVGTHALLKAARDVWLNQAASRARHYRFHHVSTDEVYGSLGPDEPAFTETTMYAPNSPYAASKAASDHLVRAYCKTYGLPVTISNCSNNYGPYQFPEKLIPLLIINCLAGRPLPIYGDGLNIRDWLHVEDHCRGIELILEKGREGEVYNLGGNCEKTNLEVVEQVCNAMDELRPDSSFTPHSSLLTFINDRPGHDRRYAIDSTKITRTLGYEAVETFASGIRKTVAWYLENEAWWQPLLKGEYRQWLAKQYG